LDTSHTRPVEPGHQLGDRLDRAGISGVASMVASSPLKNAVSPPSGWDGPSMMTRPMSMPSRVARVGVHMLDASAPTVEAELYIAGPAIVTDYGRPGRALTSDALRRSHRFAEHRNFTTAARRAAAEQPSLHVKIRKLADGLGVELYHGSGARSC
jgi:hypothetical protein